MAEKVLMIALSPTMERGTIANWIKKEGDRVASGDILCEVETDKATMEYESMQEGVLLKILVAAGQDAGVGEVIAILGQPGENFAALLAPTRTEAAPIPGPTATSVEVIKTDPARATTPEPEAQTGRVKASPLARKLATEIGLPIQALVGSGPGGRIIKRDVEGMLQPPAGSAGPASSAAPIVVSTADEVVRVSQKRRIIAQRLAESKFTAPHYYLRLSVAMDAIMAARAALNTNLPQKVSLNAFVVKFVAAALQRHPMVNASWNGDTITKFGRIDIGLAVAQPDGLITPVVRNCGHKGIVAIDAELKGLIDRALANKLTPEEYAGATFTITNLGSFGIEEFAAIINPPGSAILALGAIKKEPVVGPEDQIQIQSRMHMTLSCDHRIVDGAVGAAFLKDLKDLMEDPIRVLY